VLISIPALIFLVLALFIMHDDRKNLELLSVYVLKDVVVRPLSCRRHKGKVRDCRRERSNRRHDAI